MTEAATSRKALIRAVGHKVVLVAPDPKRYLGEQRRDLRIEAQINLVVVDGVVRGEKLVMGQQDAASAAGVIDLVC